MHARVHVAGVDRVDPEAGLLGGEHACELLERRLRGAVAAPAFVGLDGGVGGDVDDAAAAASEQRERELREPQRREDVHYVDPLELVERIVRQLRLRARAEDARVVHEQVEAAGRLRCGDERAAVPVVGDVARHDDGAEVGGRALEVVGAACVEHERPAIGGEGAGESEAEPA